MLAKSKLNSIETLMSQATIDLETIHEEFKIIVDKKKDYDDQNENIKNTKSKSELSKDTHV